MFVGPTRTGYRDRFNRWGYLPDARRFATAAHEAAHAVVAAAIGHRVTSVEVTSADCGTCHHEWQGRSADEAAVDTGIIAYAPLAGRDALEGGVAFYEPMGLYPSDRDKVGEILERLDADIDDGRDLRARFRSIARDHLQAHVKAWRSVTYYLMKYGELDAEDLADIDPDLFTAAAPAPAPVRSDTFDHAGAIRAIRHFIHHPPPPGSRVAQLIDQLQALETANPGVRPAPSYRVGNTTIETRVAAHGYSTRGAA